MFEQMKGLTPKKKVEYLLHYYGLIALVIIAIIAGAIAWIKTVATDKKDVAGIIVINAKETDEEASAYLDEYLAKVLDENGYNTKKEEIMVEPTLYIGDQYDSQFAGAEQMKLQTLLAAGAVDTIFFDESFKDEMVSYGAFCDITGYLGKDYVEANKEKLLYYTDTETNETYPVAVEVNPASKLMQKLGWFEGGTGYIGLGYRYIGNDEMLCKTILLDSLGE